MFMIEFAILVTLCHWQLSYYLPFINSIETKCILFELPSINSGYLIRVNSVHVNEQESFHKWISRRHFDFNHARKRTHQPQFNEWQWQWQQPRICRRSAYSLPRKRSEQKLSLLRLQWIFQCRFDIGCFWTLCAECTCTISQRLPLLPGESVSLQRRRE